MSFRNKMVLVICVMVLLLLFSIIARVIDSRRVEEGKMPMFCVKMATVADGGSGIYIGPGYKVIVYHKSNGYQGMQIGGWNLEYDYYLGEDIETKKMKRKSIRRKRTTCLSNSD